MLKGGGAKTFWGSFYAVAWSFSHIEGGGGRNKSPLFKKGGTKSSPPSWALMGGGYKKFQARDFPISQPPSL